jgi:hypothetical protein
MILRNKAQRALFGHLEFVHDCMYEKALLIGGVAPKRTYNPYLDGQSAVSLQNIYKKRAVALKCCYSINSIVHYARTGEFKLFS